MEKKTYISIAFGLLLVLWAVAHTAGIFWGTQNVPMHQTYVADEQRPINGALHMLQEKSMFGLRDKEEFWYGPIFAVLAVPAVVVDFTKQFLFDGVRSSQAYRDSIIFDWGGIVLWLHVTVTIAGILGLIVLFRMFLLKTLNTAFQPHHRILLAGLATSLVGCNYFFFENSTIFMNWMFVVIFLIGQLYAGLLVYESKGKKKLYWWLHGILTVLSFGINYLNIIYMIAFVPIAFVLWKANKEGVRRNLYMYTGALVLGLLFIIWWNPHTFIRLLGFLGLGSMAETINTSELNNTFTPFYHMELSFWYYGKVVLLNHISIFFALALVARSIFIKRFKENFIWMWMFGSVAFINFLVFGSLAHHEERYILITTVTLLLLAGTAVMKYLILPSRKRIVVIALSVLLVWYLSFHIAHIGKWIDIYADGPAEKAMIAEVLALQKEGESVALVQDHIAGHVHTKEAYQVFMEQKNATDVNLYKAIMAAPLPEDVPKMNARYIMLKEYEANPALIDDFTHAIQYVRICSLEINQATYIGENILSLWFWDDCKPKYIHLK